MPIAIEQLRYLVLATGDLDVAARFAETELGLQPAWRQADEAAFRSDARQYSLFYDRTLARGASAVGLQVHDAAALEAAARALAARGIELVPDPALAARRNVRALGRFATPGGVAVELVVRPQDQGWRFFATRDSGMAGLAGVALRSTDAVADEALWTEAFGLRLSDWIGDAACLALDDGQHHRLSVHPSASAGVLAVEYEVETLDHVMQQRYRLEAAGVAVAHGPGRRPASGQAFVSFEGPDGFHYSFVAEGERIDPARPRRPRQFAAGADSHCAWGSACRIPELVGLSGTATPARPQLKVFSGSGGDRGKQG